MATTKRITRVELTPRDLAQLLDSVFGTFKPGDKITHAAAGLDGVLIIEVTHGNGQG